MPLYLLDDLAFQVFERKMGEPLLRVPLLSDGKSNTKNRNLVPPDTVPHLRLHHFVDACRLAFGAFNLGPAGEDPAFLPSARRLDVYRVEGTSMATHRLEESAFSSNVKPKSGIILDVYTYNNNGQKESVDLCSRPAALEAILEYINENHEVKKDAAFPGMVRHATAEVTCMFTGEEPVLSAMHIFARRWSSPMLGLLSESSARVNAQFQAAIGNVQVHAQWYQTAKVFAPAWQELALNCDSASLTEDSLNAAFASPTCHHLLDGMYMVVHMEELLYLDRQRSSTMQSTTGAPREPQIVPVDDAASLLWAMRYIIAIFTRYGTRELRQILMSKPTPAQNDQGKKHKRDSSSSPGPPRKRRDGDDSQRDPDDSVGSSHSTVADASAEELKEMVLKFARCAYPGRALPLQSPSDSASSETDSSDDEASMSDVDAEAGVVYMGGVKIVLDPDMSDVQFTSDTEAGIVYMGGVKIVDPDPESIALDMEAVRIGALVLSSVFEQVGRT